MILEDGVAAMEEKMEYKKWWPAPAGGEDSAIKGVGEA